MIGRRLILVLLLVSAGMTLPGANGWKNSHDAVMLYVDEAKSAWSDSQLDRQVHQRMSRHESVRVTPVAEVGYPQPPFPSDLFDLDGLTSWGQEVGAAYLVLILVESVRLERGKDLHIPLLFHRYSTRGVIEGELRVLDVSRGRLALAEPFRIERKGPRALQATMDDSEHDPDLHLTAPDKVTFFHHLEEEAAGELVKRIGAVIRMR